jgi:ubiquinone/menaquinone biosynthesis C-methylase UbiE
MGLEVSAHLKANYDDYYAEGDSEWRRLGAIGKADNVVSLCRGLPDSTVIEIGAGEGSVLKRLSELGFGKNLYALDISPSGVETIRNKRVARLRECRIFDGYNVPYNNAHFDIAILSHVIEHVEYPRQLLYEAVRVSRYVFVEVPLEDTLRLPRDFTFDKVGHINFYSDKTIRRLAQSCNLRVLRQIIVNRPRETYEYQKGVRGLADYYVKQSLLKALPFIASKLFTYHGALICEGASRAGER